MCIWHEGSGWESWLYKKELKPYGPLFMHWSAHERAAVAFVCRLDLSATLYTVVRKRDSNKEIIVPWSIPWSTEFLIIDLRYKQLEEPSTVFLLYGSSDEILVHFFFYGPFSRGFLPKGGVVLLQLWYSVKLAGFSVVNSFRYKLVYFIFCNNFLYYLLRRGVWPNHV